MLKRNGRITTTLPDLILDVRRQFPTQKALAEELSRRLGVEISAQTLSSYKTGEREPPIRVALELASLLNTTVEAMYPRS